MTSGRAALHLATLGGIALGARALYHPPPLAIALSAFALYTGLVVAGVLVPRLEMFADVLWRGPEGARGVALTFDGGPHPVCTRAILARLDAAGAKGTFFVLASRAERHPGVVREIEARGHLVALYGEPHDRWRGLGMQATSAASLRRARERLASLLGAAPVFCRPAAGRVGPRIARVADELELVIVGWSARGGDALASRAAPIARRVLPRLRDGVIVQFHEAPARDEREPGAVTALDRVLSAMAARQLVGVRLDEWLGDPTTSPTAPS